MPLLSGSTRLSVPIALFTLASLGCDDADLLSQPAAEALDEQARAMNHAASDGGSRQAASGRAMCGEAGNDASANRPLPTSSAVIDQIRRGEQPACAQDSDCTLRELRTPCHFECDPVAVRRGDSEAKFAASLAELAASCPSNATEVRLGAHCGARGYEARCRANRCAYEPSVPDAQGSCAGPSGVICARCPSQQELESGPTACTVRDQRCYYGAPACRASALCEASSSGELTWSYATPSCIL